MSKEKVDRYLEIVENRRSKGKDTDFDKKIDQILKRADLEFARIFYKYEVRLAKIIEKKIDDYYDPINRALGSAVITFCTVNYKIKIRKIISSVQMHDGNTLTEKNLSSSTLVSRKTLEGKNGSNSD